MLWEFWNNISSVNRGLAINSEDRLRREIISELMCHYEANLAELNNKHGLNIDFSNELKNLSEFANAGLLNIQDDYLFITTSGQAHARAICAQFDQYLKQDTNKFSLAV